MYHIPVLRDEVAEYLRIQEGKRYIDATLGGGGHSREIIKRGGIVLGIDTDEDAIDFIKTNLAQEIRDDRLTVVQGNFRDIIHIAHLQKFEDVSGVLFDFGVSSHQLDTGSRGFSFTSDGPLDMRMSKSLGVTAQDLIHALSKKELQALFENFGEERMGYKIAGAIVEARKSQKIQTTKELVQLIENTIGKKEDIHPATRVFQALRIAVNDELRSIEEALPEAFRLLEKGGRLLAISFHSLEDRIVKTQFNTISDQGLGKLITDKIVMAREEELARNPRARSAKLRVIEKL